MRHYVSRGDNRVWDLDGRAFKVLCIEEDRVTIRTKGKTYSEYDRGYIVNNSKLEQYAKLDKPKQEDTSKYKYICGSGFANILHLGKAKVMYEYYENSSDTVKELCTDHSNFWEAFQENTNFKGPEIFVGQTRRWEVDSVTHDNIFKVVSLGEEKAICSGPSYGERLYVIDGLLKFSTPYVDPDSYIAGENLKCGDLVVLKDGGKVMKKTNEK